MAKVFGIHHISLNPGVAVSEFEAFLKRGNATVEPWPGVKNYVVVADRGHFSGQLLHILEIDDVETRNRYFPADGTPGEAMQRLAAMAAIIAEWQQYATFADGVIEWSDYVTIGEF